MTQGIDGPWTLVDARRRICFSVDEQNQAINCKVYQNFRISLEGIEHTYQLGHTLSEDELFWDFRNREGSLPRCLGRGEQHRRPFQDLSLQAKIALLNRSVNGCEIGVANTGADIKGEFGTHLTEVGRIVFFCP